MDLLNSFSCETLIGKQIFKLYKYKKVFMKIVNRKIIILFIF